MDRRARLFPLVGLACASLMLVSGVEAQSMSQAAAPNGYGLEWLLIWLLPFGVTLAGVSLHKAKAADHAALALPTAFVLALLGYSACGYAFQYGGYGLVSDEPTMANMLAEWSPLDPLLGPGWGLLGLRGFAFDLSSADPFQAGLFVSELALVTTAIAIPLLTLWGRVRGWNLFLTGLFVACVGYPVTANWIRGGGWLAHLGQTLGWGDGFIDQGLCTVFLAGGYATLASLLAWRPTTRREALERVTTLPPAHLPLLLLIGATTALLGWMASTLHLPLAITLSSWTTGTNALWALAGSVTGTLVYGWLIRGEPEAGLTGRGILASLVAISAAFESLSLWQALALGFAVGLLLAPVMWLIERWFNVDDRSSAVASHAFAGTLGLLVVGLLGDPAQGQLQAQSVGLLALIVLNVALPCALLSLLAAVVNLPRLVRKARKRRQGRERKPAGQRFRSACSAMWRYIQRGYRAATKGIAALAKRGASPQSTDQESLPTVPAGDDTSDSDQVAD